MLRLRVLAPPPSHSDIILELHKANQDAYGVTHNFAGRPTDSFFGIFDGHGQHGDKAAQYVRDNLSSVMAKAIIDARQQILPATELTKEKLHEVLSNAHIQSNENLHNDLMHDASLSGTTSISAYLQGNRNRITICNVGDSRAIIGRAVSSAEAASVTSSSTSIKSPGGTSTSSSSLKSFALSRDQTPYRLDERVRIRRAGGRILSLDQVEGLEKIDPKAAELDELKLQEGGENKADELVLGEDIDEGGDPPRVWHPTGDYPGTAFTRSFGDKVAEDLGCFAVPEMLTHDITPEDKIIVLASDGVFEFLTNQSVIDICAKFTDPLEACRAVVAESYELWLQYELRTDDITMICIFLDDVVVPTKELTSNIDDRFDKSLEELRKSSTESMEGGESRPVRTKMTKEKQRALTKLKMSCHDVSPMPEEEFDLETLYNVKTDEEKARIAEAIRTPVIFQNITDMQRELIYKVLEPMDVKAGQKIVIQGTKGDRFYIVDDGSFEVRVLAEGQEDIDGKGGDVVHVYEGSRENNFHPCFGELALKYSAPRAASIVAKTDGKLWALHRYAYNKIKDEED